MAAEDDAGAVASELGLLLADGSDAGFGVAAGADVAGAVPLKNGEGLPVVRMAKQLA